jgi:hypothetical protein
VQITGKLALSTNTTFTVNSGGGDISEVQRGWQLPHIANGTLE